MFIHACYLTRKDRYRVSFAAFNADDEQIFSIDIDLSERDMTNLTEIIAHAMNRVPGYTYTPINEDTDNGK